MVLPSIDWSFAWKVLFLFGNGSIALAFFLIPYYLVRVWSRRRNDEVTRPCVLIRFAVAIFLCGLTRLAAIVALVNYHVWPVYVALTVINGFAALEVARILPRVIRHLLALPSRQAVHDALDLAQAAYVRETELRVTVEARNAELAGRVLQLENALDEMRWHAGARDAIKGMRDLLAGG